MLRWLFGSLQVVSQRYLWTEHEAPVTMDTAGQSGEGCHAVSTGWCNKTHSKHNELPLSPNHNEQTLLSGHASIRNFALQKDGRTFSYSFGSWFPSLF